MKILNNAILVLLFCTAANIAADAETAEGPVFYRQTCDASAAVAIGNDMFVVADDENNILRVYKTRCGSLPLFSYDLTEFLGTDPKHPEADIEAATIIGDTIYWITSHGRNKDGKIRPNRYRFFATSIKIKNEKVTIKPIGTPYRNLVHKLTKTEAMRKLGLNGAAGFYTANLTKLHRKNLAPKISGLNIEGLCACPDGKVIYIGFRNPRPADDTASTNKALVVSLNNPRQVIEKSKEPLFGDPLLWDLGGLGIRSMEYSHFHKAYFIIAGPHNETPDFALYRWSGKTDTPPKLLRPILSYKSDFTPEALVTFKKSDTFFLLSDDGSLEIDVSGAAECMEGQLLPNGRCPNKFLTNQNRKQFRGIWLKP
ncbi:MAG: DUF3616 domain-containing protein [Planctomycetota bacterium]|jgi:hypothetical protein